MTLVYSFSVKDTQGLFGPWVSLKADNSPSLFKIVHATRDALNNRKIKTNPHEFSSARRWKEENVELEREVWLGNLGLRIRMIWVLGVCFHELPTAAAQISFLFYIFVSQKEKSITFPSQSCSTGSDDDWGSFSDRNHPLPLVTPPTRTWSLIPRRFFCSGFHLLIQRKCCKSAQSGVMRMLKSFVCVQCFI